MKRIIIVGIAILIVLAVGLFIFNDNTNTTVGEVFEDIKNEHGDITSISLEDEDTLESTELANEESINES